MKDLSIFNVSKSTKKAEVSKGPSLLSTVAIAMQSRLQPQELLTVIMLLKRFNELYGNQVQRTLEALALKAASAGKQIPKL